METPLSFTSRDCFPPNFHNGYLKTDINREIRFVITHSATEKAKGTVVILESYANAIEEYFSSMNEISQRSFYTTTFDWFGRDGSQPNKQKQSRHNYFDINSDINDLDVFINKIIYPNCPPPYYMLTYGMGGLIALSGLSIINHKFKKMLCVSPLFAPLGNKTNSFQHKLIQLLSDIGLGKLAIKGEKKLKQAKQKDTQLGQSNEIPLPLSLPIKPPTVRWMASTLNAIDAMKKNILNGHLQIPTLFILANQNNIANNIEARKLCLFTHLAESITIIGAELNTIMHEEYYQKQFWAAFDAFIPGTYP
ncbi:serine aminopeptidase domain-containing protein [Bartonella sp. A05]|uniref:serine aminopeptidase domain-containing protein n=1 Tax=Bartonella sp. A05 TaxID=2967261 RepID=UPI0022A9A2DB|nr:alpha/beta hydrolase [Bartonella sp. A05]MCZ2204196.1 alpha/beta hydrolase [Bartonella sp. A05]